MLGVSLYLHRVHRRHQSIIIFLKLISICEDKYNSGLLERYRLCPQYLLIPVDERFPTCTSINDLISI